MKYEMLKSSVKVTELIEIKSTDMTGAEAAMLATLQGLISNKTEKRIFINCMRTDWSLEDLIENHGIKVRQESNVWNIVQEYKEYIKGYVLYNGDCSDYNPDAKLVYNKDADESINVANTVAPFYEAVIVDQSIEEQVKKLGIPMLMDVSNKTSEWAFDNYWDRVNHDIVAEIFPQLKMFLRDYAYMTKSFVFHKVPQEGGFREKILSHMNTNGALIGWSHSITKRGELDYISEASKYGIATIPSDWSPNISVFSSFPEYKSGQHKRNVVENEKGVHYVTILMSDGDNEQWVFNDLLTSRKWFGNEYKGQFDVAFAMPPYLYDHAPTLLEKMYKMAGNTDKGQEQFIVGPSGLAYMYPSLYPEDKLDAHVMLLNDYMAKTDTHVVAIIDDGALDKKEIWDKYTAQSEIKGLFYLEYFVHSTHKGKMYFSNEKPVVSCADMLWVDLTDDDEVVERVNKGSVNVEEPEAYSMIYVHAWSKNMDDVAKMVSKFDEHVRVVNAEQFMDLITKNVKK